MEKSLDDLYGLLSQMTSRMDEEFERVEKRIELIEQKLDKLFGEVQGISEEQSYRKGLLTFLDMKALEHEKELYFLNDQLNRFGKEES